MNTITVVRTFSLFLELFTECLRINIMFSENNLFCEEQVPWKFRYNLIKVISLVREGVLQLTIDVVEWKVHRIISQSVWRMVSSDG